MHESDILSLPHWPLLAGFCLCLVLGAALFASRSADATKLPLPPQPKGNLILGNLSEVITASKESLQHLLMHRWAREHGEVFRVRLGPVTEYFLNSDRAVKVSLAKWSRAERNSFVCCLSFWGRHFNVTNSCLLARKSWIARPQYRPSARDGSLVTSSSVTS
jgi:hypothetical protein